VPVDFVPVDFVSGESFCYAPPMVDLVLELAVAGRVAGVDEAGRGPLAGPVVAAAVVFAIGPSAALAALIDDSKRLTPQQRDTAYQALCASPGVEIGVGAASVAEVAQLNILRASLLAMRRAVCRLPAVPDLALVDGNQPPPLDCLVRCPSPPPRSSRRWCAIAPWPVSRSASRATDGSIMPAIPPLRTGRRCNALGPQGTIDWGSARYASSSG
jgi:hypothetical protein